MLYDQTRAVDPLSMVNGKTMELVWSMGLVMGFPIKKRANTWV
jgi:hypothetical protein